MTVLRTRGGQSAQNHLRMFDKVTVDGKSLRAPPQMYPVRLNIHAPVAFLQKNNIADNVRSGVGFERVVGQSNRAQKFRSLGKIFADFRRLRVHRVAGSHKRHDASGSRLIQGFGEKVIVDRESEPIVRRIVYLILSERDVSDS